MSWKQLVTYDKEMRETAKREQLPLVVIGFDTRFMPKDKRRTNITSKGPMSEAKMLRVRALVLELMKEDD